MVKSMFLEKNQILFQNNVAFVLNFYLSYFYVIELPFQDNDLFSNKAITFELFKEACLYLPSIDQNHNSRHHLI